MQLLNRLLVVLLFGLFGVTALLMAYSSYVARQSGRVSVEQGNDFPGSWIFLMFIVLFGIALCILSIYCLFTSQPIAFARIHQYLSMAAPLLWTRQPDTVGVMGLALNATLERDGFQDERDRIRELLTVARSLWDEMAAIDDPEERRRHMRATFRMVYLADVLAVTVGA